MIQAKINKGIAHLEYIAGQKWLGDKEPPKLSGESCWNHSSPRSKKGLS